MKLEIINYIFLFNIKHKLILFLNVFKNKFRQFIKIMLINNKYYIITILFLKNFILIK